LDDIKEEENAVKSTKLEDFREEAGEEIRQYIMNDCNDTSELGDQELLTKEMNPEGKKKWHPTEEDLAGIDILLKFYPKLDQEMAKTLYMADKNGELEKVMAEGYEYKHHTDELYTDYPHGSVLKGEEWAWWDNTNTDKPLEYLDNQPKYILKKNDDE